jgi:hypothetical protein
LGIERDAMIPITKHDEMKVSFVLAFLVSADFALGVFNVEERTGCYATRVEVRCYLLEGTDDS